MADLPSILFVACDSHLAGIYAKKFDADGWDIEVADNLADAEKKAIKIRPQVILLDADCAVDISGEVARLKKMPTLQKTKIAILATLGDREEIAASMQAGADTYLVLGQFVPQELLKKMRALIGK